MKHLSCLLLAVLFLTGCETTPRPPPPTIDQVVQWSNEKMPPEEIIARMRESRAVYPLSASHLADLRTRGVSDKVIDYMQQAFIAAERYDEYLRTRDQYFFYGPGFYGPFWSPYPHIHHHHHHHHHRK